ncbi:hypothetical protein BPAE_0181g00090 [Botrytis paeoniae]|uniref:Uncharacterized protein n=1 Tax=Botrytis paeoniae TaxID=278948 RepID=A0A4Z1FCB6_9HELO|nr:hypothetical protein BPAE_0181g00090 [Botrytis paeoniae]
MDGIPGGQALSFKTSGFGTPMKTDQIIHQACIKNSIGNEHAALPSRSFPFRVQSSLMAQVTFSARKMFLIEIEGKRISTGIGPLLDPRHAEILTSTDHDTVPSRDLSPKLQSAC